MSAKNNKVIQKKKSSHPLKRSEPKQLKKSSRLKNFNRATVRSQKRHIPYSKPEKKQQADLHRIEAPLPLVKKKPKGKGRPIECRYCKHQFHVPAEAKPEWALAHFPCPGCGIDYSCMPPSERTLFRMQNEYIETRNPLIIDQMYRFLKPYARSMVKKKHPRYITEPELLDMHSHGATFFLLDHYFKDPNWKIGTSFAGYLKDTVTQSVYDPPDIPEKKQAFSLDQISAQTRKNYTVSTDENFVDRIENDFDSYRLKEHIFEFVDRLSKYSSSRYAELCRYIALVCHFEHGEKRKDGFFHSNFRAGKAEFDRTMEFTKDELHRLQRGD